MNKEQKKFWKLYVVAVGLDTLMTQKEMAMQDDCYPYYELSFPPGLCDLIDKMKFSNTDRFKALISMREYANDTYLGYGFFWKAYD